MRVDGEAVDQQAIFAAVKKLGYKPSWVEEPETSEDVAPSEDRATSAEVDGQWPEPIGSAVARARERGTVVLLDFHAKWCGPCKKMDREVFSREEVQKALAQVEFLKVDTDEHPAVARSFGVVAMPTLVVLDGEGVEQSRHVGPMGAEALLSMLAGRGP